MAAADKQLAERQAEYEIGMARSAATWDMVDEQLRAAAIEVERARQHHASAAADVDRLSRRESELSSQLAEAGATHSVLEHRLADAETAVEAATARAEHERFAAAEQLAERQRELTAQIAQEVEKRHSAEDWLAQSVSALDDAEKRHASAIMDAAAQSRELEAALRLARQEVESKAADVERLTKRETDLSSLLADVTTIRTDLERRLAATDAAFEDAGKRATRERLAASKKAAVREAELDGQIRQERATRATLEQTIADADAALRDAHQRHNAALTTAANELAERQARFDRELSQTAADRDRLTQQLSDAEVVLEHVRRDHQSTTADLERLMQREAEVTSQLADVKAARHTLELQLTDAIRNASAREAELDGQIRQERALRVTLEQTIADGVVALRDAHAALRDAQQRHDAALTTAANELAERQARFDRELSQTAADRDRLTRRVNEAEVAVDQERRDHQLAAADVERLTQREADLTCELAEVKAARHVFELQLADAASAIRDASAREAELDGEIRQERATRAALEQTIAHADAALRDAQERHDVALATAADELAARQTRFDRELSQTAADRDRLTQQLSDAGVALDHMRRDQQSTAADVERLTRREADLTCELAEVKTARHTLELQLADAASAIRVASAREAELDGQITQERATRATLEQTIADADATLRDALQAHDVALTTAANELAARQARFDRELSQTAADRDRLTLRLSDAEVALDRERGDHRSTVANVERLAQREAALTCELAEAKAARHTLELQLSDAASTIADANERTARERAEAADRQADLEARLAQEIAARDTLDQTLAESRSTALDAQRSLREEADALRARALEHEAQVEVRFAQEQLEHETRLAEMQECNRALALERDTLRQSLQTMQAQADLVPRLHEQLDESRAESHRLFEQAGLAMFRCTPDGALTHANRACTTLVGRRTVDELHGVHFVGAVFEAPTVLSWLIERCVSTRAKESIETTWRRKDGRRLFVRLSARLSAPDEIEIVAEDLTRVRVLEERLGEAHRMEAVGRLASEIAVTCGNLLSDIHQQGVKWLATANGDADSRQHGELLLDEVRRAAGFVRQLAVSGDEQTRTPMLVDLNTLIRDLEPVLKRVAGGDVDIRLRDTSSSLNVDVGTERVERLLVNLASYGRQRMPFGGRLQIELGRVVVDRRFAAKHPNVRLGLHALITMTEIKRAARADGLSQPRDGATTHNSPGRVAPKPGIDFATLQGLVSESGGHLWMKVQPLGDMVAKIRLPLLSPHDQTLPRTPTPRGGRERQTTRWFQS
jgi:chromosome segregation ATPase